MNSKNSVTSKDMACFFLLILKQAVSPVSLSFVCALKLLLILCCSRFEFCKQGSFVEPFTFKKCPWAELSANLSWNSALITFWEIRSCLWCLWEWHHQAVIPTYTRGISVLFLSVLLSLLAEIAGFSELWMCVKVEGMQTFFIPPKRADLLAGLRTAQPVLVTLHKQGSVMQHLHPLDLYQYHLAAKL